MRISINNHSTVVNNDEVKAILPALRGQASELCYAWGLDRPTIGFQLLGSTVAINIFDDMVDLEKIGCMVLINGKRCGRPVQYVFEGAEGPFYRCGKGGRVLARQRDDVEVLEG